MEHQKILNLLNDANNSYFLKRKWNIANDNSNNNYDEANDCLYNAEVLKYALCGYNDAYILVRGNITVTAAPQIQVAFEN